MLSSNIATVPFALSLLASAAALSAEDGRTGGGRTDGRTTAPQKQNAAKPTAGEVASAPDAAGKRPNAPRSLGTPAKPNILFVIIDDAGVDQFERWNPAGVELAKTPVIDSLCDQGVRFSNVWSMPQCSPSRVAMMTGRYPFRTGVLNACLDTAPPRSQASPYEFTLPQLLASAGYASGYVGKFHLGDPVLNPEGDLYVNGLGFPHFQGTSLGGASLIDTTISGQMAPPAAGAAPIYSSIPRRTRPPSARAGSSTDRGPTGWTRSTVSASAACRSSTRPVRRSSWARPRRSPASTSGARTATS
jgi:hypothetical protein